MAKQIVKRKENEIINPKKEILKLKDGESWEWEDDAEVWFKYNTYFLFEVPQFGGMPIFWAVYSKHNINGLIKTVESWT